MWAEIASYTCMSAYGILNFIMLHVFQYQLRIKTIAYEFLQGKKPNLQLGEKWIGDELGNRKLNPRAQEFIDSVSFNDNGRSMFNLWIQLHGIVISSQAMYGS
jgi:hypothetical protein